MNGRRSGQGRPRRAGVVVALPGPTDARVLRAVARDGELVAQSWGAAPSGPGPEDQARALARALATAGIPERRLFLCLPGASVLLRRVQLPPAAPEQLPQLAAYEAQRHLPLPVDQIAVGYQSIGNGAENTFLLAIARKADLQRLEQALHDAGLSVEGYGVETIAAVDACRAARDTPDPDRAELILARAGGIHAGVLRGEQLLYVRYLHGTGDWHADLRRSLLAYSLERPNEPVHGALLVGDLGELPPSVLPGLPTRRAALEPAHAGGIEVPLDYLPLVGLAAQVLGLGRYPLRLPPQGREASPAESRSRTALAVGAVIALGAWAALAQIDLHRARQADRERAARVTRQIERDRRQVATLRKERVRLREQIAAIGGEGLSAAPLELLRTLALLAPPDLWLTELHYQATSGGGARLQLQGNARSASGVTAFLRALERAPAFRQVDLAFLSRATVDEVEVNRFRIDCRTTELEAGNWRREVGARAQQAGGGTGLMATREAVGSSGEAGGHR